MVDYKRIRQANELLSILEQGDFNQAVTVENEKLLETLSELAPPKGKAVKGTLTIVVGYAVVGNQVEISAQVTSKAPKPVRGTTHLWMNADMTLNTEHPKQTSMAFDDPKVSSIRDNA